MNSRDLAELSAICCRVNRKIKFGELFEKTTQIFEALSGTLVAAKKRGVVECELLSRVLSSEPVALPDDGSLLLQRMHDNVVITLLLDEIEDSPLPPVRLPHLRLAPATVSCDARSCSRWMTMLRCVQLAPRPR